MKFFLSLLEKTFENEKPLAKLLETRSGYYLYDTGTNKILGCRKEVYDLLQGLFFKDVKSAIADIISKYTEKVFFKAAEEIVEAINTEKILLLKKAENFCLSDHFNDFKNVLNSSMKGMNLEVTEKCPLRCSYCVYQDHYREQRRYSNKSMKLETAKKAIQLLKEHSTHSDTILLGFYGGEPLLQFSLIKACVDYAKKIFNGKELLFNITTNAVLVNKQIAKFLFNEGFSVLVSLDGPEDINDMHRKYKNGQGSFEKTFNGLRILADKYRRMNKGMISINAVYMPPYSEEKINRIHNFFKELKFLHEFNVFTNYTSRNSIPADMVVNDNLKQDKNIIEWSFEKYNKDFHNSSSMVKGKIERKFASFIQRPILAEPITSFKLNGCCLPGQRKCYITTDGSIKICEKISHLSPPIGNVNSGFDFETIDRIYIQDYAEKSFDSCSICWGIGICDVCYIHVFNEHGELDMNRKKMYCHAILHSLENSLKRFAAILEENPGKLDYLYEYKIT